MRSLVAYTIRLFLIIGSNKNKSIKLYEVGKNLPPPLNMFSLRRSRDG